MHNITEELRLLFTSAYPLVYMVTHEEERGRRLILEALAPLGHDARVWNCAGGDPIVTGGHAAPAAPTGPGAALVSDNRDPLRLLSSLRTAETGVTVLCDFHVYLGDPAVVRRMRELLPVLERAKHTLVILSPVLVIPSELEKDLAIIDVPLPSPAELDALLRRVCDEEQVIFPEDFLNGVIRAARGLTENEARRVFTKALRKGGGFKLDDLTLIVEEKKQAIRKSDVLDFFDLDEDLDQVGGLEEVKRWVRHRSKAFDDEAARYGLPAPKGLLLIGVQGCGKSLTAKAVAGAFRLPLVRLDLAAVFGSASPEISMRRAIQVAESLAPVVLWVDEIEKGFAETGAGGSSTRVFGSFITWLQEKQAPVFVVATANEVEHLPPELLRKGRFDEIFFVDLPDVHERASILSIHLKKRKRDPAKFEVDTLARQSEHFSGAELEQGVLAGMFRAFAGKREVQTRDIQQELDLIVPLYVMYEEKIKALREWAKTRTRRASLDQSLVDLFEKE
jgi:ATP-dependent 26S proteasome regulatory subunit